MVISPNLGIADPGLCLAFVNTEGIVRNSPPDRLESLDLFLEWAVREGVLERERIGELERSLRGPLRVADFLERGRQLREALYRIFGGIAGGGQPADHDLAVVDRQLDRAMPELRFGREGGRFGWRLAEPPRQPDDLLLPIALSAADLLCSDRLGRVKECNGETCSWMFLDESRNRSRRWCDMSDCGNRAKAKRFYRRHSRSSRPS